MRPQPAHLLKHRLPHPAAVTALLALAATALAAAFAFGDLTGAVEYILPRRLTKVGAMAAVAAAVALSTLLFQTVTANRILTPSIMGLDALYVLLQTALVFLLGAHAWATADELVRFSIEAVLLVLFSALLYSRLFLGTRPFRGRARGRKGAETGSTGFSLHLMLLAGIVLGALFRGVSGLLQRLIDPNDYLVLQDLFFASFNQVSPRLLGAAAAVIGVCALIAWRMRRTLDVLALGRETAVGLGVDHRRATVVLLLVSAVLVAVSTALVGPATFFGLLVVSVGYQLCRTYRHAWLMPIITLLAVIALVGGQLLVERVFAFRTPLSVIIEFIGGIVFLVLVLRGALK